jgi:GNAT superfamily N-acetyltransferase
MAKIREATQSDNNGLLSLTAMTPMSGEISIRSDRYPDFFRLLDRRGYSHVLVAEENGKIVGCVSTTRVPVHVNGELEYVHYLGDLKVHPDFRGRGLAVRLLISMHRHLLAADADLVLGAAAYGNEDIMPFFDGRAGLPKAVLLGVFKVYQILPSHRQRATTHYAVKVEPENPDMYRLYNDHFRHYQFGPVLPPGSLLNARHLVARSGGASQASLSVVDVGDSRQNVLIRLPFILGILAFLLRFLRRMIPIAALPEINEPIRILYVKALACREGYEDALDPLIQKARNICCEERYHFLAIGVHEKDPLGKRFVRYPKFVFKSMGFVVSLKRGNDEVLRLMRGVPYEDYSLV